ncbi:MAG: NUDIX domain-containing protein [Lentihominibacter sp.]|jgi:8-oxo-dGTP diphosphatase
MWVGGVRVILLDEENRMLMLKQRHENREIWMPPGGGIEDNENSVQAAVREVKEETGLDIRIGELIWHVEEVSERGQRFVNFFRGHLISEAAPEMDNTPILGMDPELGEDEQVLMDVKFLTRDEINMLPDVYPEYLRDEIWEILEGNRGHKGFKIRRQR